MADRQRTDAIVIHCSATPPTLTIGRDEINAWHRQQGWKAIGYHFVIRRDGWVEPGRRMTEIGAHVAGYNSTSIAICLVGGVGIDGRTAENNFTHPQWVALDALMAVLRQVYPTARVLGHRDFPGVNKACPSFDVSTWYGQRTRLDPITT